MKNSKPSNQELNSMTDSDDNDSQLKPRNKNYLSDIKQKMLFLEYLVIYPQDLQHSLTESTNESGSKCSNSNELNASSTPNSSQIISKKFFIFLISMYK